MSPSKAARRRDKEIARQTRSAGRPRGAGAERMARLRAQQRRRRRGKQSLVGGAIAVTVAIAAIGVGNLMLDRAVGAGDDADLTAMSTFTNTAGHVTTPVDYPQTPPAGGPHDPVWLNCGVYSEPVANENAVHGLEHGAVWVTYRPDLPDADIAALTAAAAGQSFQIVSPYPDLPAPVVVSSWNRQLQLPTADDPRLVAFIVDNKLSADAPEPGAPCTGGIGTPTA